MKTEKAFSEAIVSWLQITRPVLPNHQRKVEASLRLPGEIVFVSEFYGWLVCVLRARERLLRYTHRPSRPFSS